MYVDCKYMVVGVVFGGSNVIKYVSWLVYWCLIVKLLSYYDVVSWYLSKQTYAIYLHTIWMYGGVYVIM
jgi:hypothetical protein